MRILLPVLLLISACAAPPGSTPAGAPGSTATEAPALKGGDPAAASGASATPPLTPPANLRYSIGPGVSEPDAAALREGVAIVSRYFATRLGGDRSGPAVARVYVGTGREEHCCFAGPGAFDIITSNHFWTTPGAPSHETWPAETERRELAAHEYVHVWQHEVGGGSCMRGPARWLSEGMAEWVAYESLIDAGLITKAQHEIFIERQLRSGRYAPLWDLVRAFPFDVKPYAMGYLAVDRLVQARGPLALRDWCQRVGGGEEWTSAFQAAFGEPIGDFYVRFEVYRSEYVR